MYCTDYFLALTTPHPSPHNWPPPPISLLTSRPPLPLHIMSRFFLILIFNFLSCIDFSRNCNSLVWIISSFTKTVCTECTVCTGHFHNILQNNCWNQWTEKRSWSKLERLPIHDYYHMICPLEFKEVSTLTCPIFKTIFFSLVCPNFSHFFRQLRTTNVARADEWINGLKMELIES